METFLSGISAKQAKEWELFAVEEPAFEDKVIVQLALIAHLFANSFIQRTDKKKWSLSDFIPDFSNKLTSKNKPIDLKNKVFGILGTHGNDKAKERAKKHFKRQDKSNTEGKIRGTDGKLYKYRMEEFVKDRKTLPKRLRRK